MRKHLLRFLLIVMIVCFGVGIMAACGDDTEGENPNPGEATTYTLTYKANGGVGNDKTEQHKEGDTVTVLGANTFSRDGYTFTKWKEEGGSAEYNAGATFTMPARNVTLAAQWQANGSTEAEYEINVTDPTGKAHVEFDKAGPYHKGDVVRFTVDFAPGENLRVVSVKADGVELQKGEDGKYTVTVAEKDVEITITSEPMGEHEFNVSLSVTGEGNGNSATLDKEGTVGKDEKVTLTVVIAEGYTAEVKLNGNPVDLDAEGKYELTVTENAAFTVTFTKNGTVTQEYTVSLNVTGEGNGNSATLDKSGKVAKDTKVTLTVVTAEGYTAEVKLNGNKVNLTAEGKYEHTVTADAAFTVTFTKNDEPGPGPSAKDLTTFHNAGMLADGSDIQLILRFNATGYANADELKGDLKVAVGGVEVAPYQVDFSADGANTAYFHIPVADLTIESGNSAQVTLKSTAAAKTYDVPATSVDANQSTAEFSEGTYTLKLEGGKLVIACTKQSVTPGPGDKALSDFGVSDIITFGTEGVRIVLRFKATGYDNDTIKSDITIKINNVSIAAQEVGGSAAAGYDVYFLLKPEDIAKLGNEPGKITLVAGEEEYTRISNGTIGQNNAEFNGRVFTLSVAENELTLTVTATSTESTVNVTVTGKPAEVQGDGYELKNGDDAVTSGGKVPTTATLTLTVTVPEGYKATVNVDGATLEGSESPYTIKSLTATVTITITYAEEGEEPEKALSDFGASDVITYGTEGVRILLRFKATGYDADTIKSGITIKINGETITAHEVGGDPATSCMVYFLLKAEDIAKLGSEPCKVTLVAGGEEYTKISNGIGQNNAKFDGKTFTLSVADNELTLAVSGGSAPDPTVKSFNITGGDIVLENESIYFVVNGTYTLYTEAEVKEELLKYKFDLQKLSGAVSGIPDDWSVQTKHPLETLEANITVADGTWRVRYDISGLDSYAYAAHFSPAETPADLKVPAEDGKELQFGGRKYTLHYTAGGANQLTYWGCVGLRIESLSDPVKLDAPSISVDGKNLTITDGNEKGVKEYRIGVFNSDGLQLRTYTLTEKTGTIDDTRLQDGAYTLKVMAVPSSVDYLESDWSAAANYTVSYGKFEYELNYGGEAGMAYDEWIYWEQDSGNVTKGVSKYSDGVVTITFTNNNVTDPGLFYATQIFYKSTALKEGDTYTLTLKITSTASGKITINGTEVDLVANEEKSVPVSGLTQGPDSTVSIQCAVNGADVSTRIKAATFTIKDVQVDVEEPAEKTLAFSDPELRLADGVVYLVVKVNSTLYSVEELGTMKLFDGTAIIDLDADKSNLVADGQSEAWFALNTIKNESDQPNRWFWTHIQINGEKFDGANGDLKPTGGVSEAVVSSAEVDYNLHSEGGQLVVVAKNRPAATDPVYEATKVELVSEGEKVYFVVSGTYKNYEQDALETLLNGLDFNLQHIPGAAGSTGSDYWLVTGFPKTVTVSDGGTWEFRIEVTVGLSVTTQKKTDEVGDFGKGAYVVHLPTTTYSNGDIKVTDATDGFTVECGEYKYQLVNKNGETAEKQYWGCVGLLIYGKDDVIKQGNIDYSTIKLEEVDGKPILTIGGTHENCTEDDFKFDLELSGAVVHACTVDLSQPGKFTVTVDLSDVGVASRYIMHLKIAGVGDGNVANKDTDPDGTLVSTLNIGTKTYSVVKMQLWGSCFYTLKVEDSAAPALSDWTAELAQKDGSVYLKLTATAAYYDDDLVKKLAFAGKDGGLVVDQPGIATLDGTTVTIMINVSDIAKKGNNYLNKWWRAYLTLDGNPIDNPNCATKTEANLDVGGFLYELRYDNGLPYVNIKEGTPVAHAHTFVNGVCTDCKYVCAHTFTTSEGECSVCGYVTGKNISSKELGAATNGWGEHSEMYTMTKPAEGKVLQIVYTATFDTDTVSMNYDGIVTRFFDGGTELAFLQGSCFALEMDSKPWSTNVNIDRTTATYGDNSKAGYFCRVTVLWEGTTIKVTYQFWTADDDVNMGPDKTGKVIFSNVDKDTYNVFFGLDGVTSTDAKLVVNEYTAPVAPESPKTNTTTQNVAKADVPTLWNGYLTYQIHEYESIVVTGQHAGGNRAWAGMNAFIFDRTATGEANKDWLYIFRAAGDCASTGWQFAPQEVSLTPGFIDSAEFIAAKEHGNFEISVSMVDDTITIIYKIWAQGKDTSAAADYTLCAVFTNMTLDVYDIGFGIDAATATQDDATADGLGSITEAGLVVKLTTVATD